MHGETKKMCVTLIIVMVWDQTHPVSEESPYQPKCTQMHSEKGQPEKYFLTWCYINILATFYCRSNCKQTEVKEGRLLFQSWWLWTMRKIRISVVKSKLTYLVYIKEGKCLATQRRWFFRNLRWVAGKLRHSFHLEGVFHVNSRLLF